MDHSYIGKLWKFSNIQVRIHWYDLPEIWGRNQRTKNAMSNLNCVDVEEELIIFNVIKWNSFWRTRLSIIFVVYQPFTRFLSYTKIRRDMQMNVPGCWNGSLGLTKGLSLVFVGIFGWIVGIVAALCCGGDLYACSTNGSFPRLNSFSTFNKKYKHIYLQTQFWMLVPPSVHEFLLEVVALLYSSFQKHLVVEKTERNW